MKKKFYLSVFLCLLSMAMPAVAQMNGWFTGKRVLDRVEVEEIIPGSSESSIKTYFVDDADLPVGAFINTVILEMNFESDGGGNIFLFGNSVENPDIIQLTDDSFTFAAQGQPVLQGANEYTYSVETETDELILTPQTLIYWEEKYYRVKYFSLKRK